MSKWGELSVKIDADSFGDAVANILRDYGDVVYKLTEDALDAAENVLISNLQANTPVRTGRMKRNWKSTKRKYKLARYIGNTTTVKGKKGDISLVNIFEYSTTRGKPFVKQTFNDSINEMAAAAVRVIKGV